jgi:ATPase family associated with various cellular activities (AAA)
MSDPHRIRCVKVIGDITEDILSFNGTPFAHELGGAFFVQRMLDSALRKTHHPPTPKALTYDKEPGLYLPRAQWKLRQVELRPHHDDPDQIRSSAGQQHVFRLHETPRSCIELERPTPASGSEPTPLGHDPCDLLVIEDLNLDASFPHTLLSRTVECHGHLDWLARQPIDDYCPRIVAMINRHLPNLPKNALWKDLHALNRDRTIVLLYADVLRWDGLAISKQISWERTAQDFLAQFCTDPNLQFLADFQHVIVRFGVTAAIHSYRIGKRVPKRRVHRLYFAPNAPQYGVFRDTCRDGDMIGHNSIYVASIIQELTNFANDEHRDGNCHNEYAIAETIGDGIRDAIVRTQMHFAAGYGPTKGSVEAFVQGDSGGFQPDLFGPVGKRRDAIGDERIPEGNLSWNILNQSARYRLIDVAQEIVVAGVDSALNQPTAGREPVWGPIVKFRSGGEDLYLVDRREIESYRSVHNMLRDARNGNVRRRPLSIAVFGPPGSGKSFSIKVLAGSAELGVPREINLASHTSATFLRGLFKWARQTQWTTGTPLIFFDEFDCRFENKEMGWLKYFLPIMERWDVGRPPKDRPATAAPKGGPPIFIFAGGTSYTYRDFSRAGSGSKEHELRFARAKGPDFVSRLSGHIDIVGPNPIDEYDQAYVIRRALVLRQILEKRSEAERRQGARFDEWFQPDLIRAMLTVSTFKHGNRSMRAIVDMSLRFGGESGRYVSTSLPPAHQLDMHVDGKELLRRIEEAKKESEIERQRHYSRSEQRIYAAGQSLSCMYECKLDGCDEQTSIKRKIDTTFAELTEGESLAVAKDVFRLKRDVQTKAEAKQEVERLIMEERQKRRRTVTESAHT